MNQYKIIKSYLQIIAIAMVFFLSWNINSQKINKESKYKISNSYTTNTIHKYQNNIRVISILDADNTAELKKLDQFAGKYKNRNVTFLAVTDHMDNCLSNAIKDEILYYQHLSSAENKEVFNSYQKGMYKVFPIHIVINKEGKIVYKKKGFSNNIEDKLAKKIDKLLLDSGEESIQTELQYTVR